MVARMRALRGLPRLFCTTSVVVMMGCNAIVGNEEIVYTEDPNNTPNPEPAVDGSTKPNDSDAGPGQDASEDSSLEDGGGADGGTSDGGSFDAASD